MIKRLFKYMITGEIYIRIMIKLLDENRIEQSIKKATKLFDSYSYFFCCEREMIDSIPLSIYFDDDSLEYVISFEQKDICLKRGKYNIDEMKDFPLMLNNCFEAETLDFLTMAVRDSMFCAADNHIYLYYDNPAAFYLMLCLNDIDKLLKSEKFIFLLGEAAKSEYPIDFKEKFGIDYSSMQPQLLQPDELFRICFFLKGTFSGADFISNVIAQSDDVILVRLWSLHNKTTILEKPLDVSEKYFDIINDIEKEYETDKVLSFFKENTGKICFTWSGDGTEMRNYPGDEEFIDLLGKILTKPIVTISDIFKAYFIAKDFFCAPEKAYNYRIVPLLLFEPHTGNPGIYGKIFESFEFKMQFSGFRDPLKRLASGLRREDVPPYGLNMPIPYSISEGTAYYAVKFEDLKLYPNEICHSMCRNLNIRFTDKMLSLDYYEKSTFDNNIVKGYDIQPVIRPVDDMLGLFDQMRLRFFFKDSTDYFDYPVFFEEDLSDIKVERLFMIPFRVYYKISPEISEDQKEKIINGFKRKLINNYIKLADGNRVRQIDMERMPHYLKNENIYSYRGAVSFNGENHIYSEDTEDLFRLLDEFLIYFAQNQDMTLFKDEADLDIIDKNILKLLALYFEQKQLSYIDVIPKQLLYEITNTNIKLDMIISKKIEVSDQKE